MEFPCQMCLTWMTWKCLTWSSMSNAFDMEIPCQIWHSHFSNDLKIHWHGNSMSNLKLTLLEKHLTWRFHVKPATTKQHLTWNFHVKCDFSRWHGNSMSNTFFQRRTPPRKPEQLKTESAAWVRQSKPMADCTEWVRQSKPMADCSLLKPSNKLLKPFRKPSTVKTF